MLTMAPGAALAEILTLSGSAEYIYSPPDPADAASADLTINQTGSGKVTINGANMRDLPGTLTIDGITNSTTGRVTGPDIEVGNSTTRMSNSVGGIVAKTVGAGSIFVATGAGGTVTKTGIFAAVGAEDTDTSNTGSVFIDAGANVTGDQSGVAARSRGSGSVTVQGAGNVSGAAPDGKTGDPVYGNGIYAYSTGGGNVTVAGAGTTSATGVGNAIEAQLDLGGASSLLLITRRGAITAENGKGIRAAHNGTAGKIVIAGIGAVTSTGDVAISAQALGGDVNIGVNPADGSDEQRQNSKLSQAVSGTTGIVASTIGSGAVRIATGTGGTVTGTSAEGISAQVANGPIDIDVGAAVTGKTTGINAIATGSGSVHIVTRAGDATNPGGTVTGTTDKGISAQVADRGAVDIDVGANVTGAKIGVSAITKGTGAIVVGGSGDIKGQALTDNLQDLNYGNGIYAYAQGGGAVTIEGTGATTATGYGKAIEAQIDRVPGSTTTSNIVITRSGLVSAADGKGIQAQNKGGGNIMMARIGAVTSTGNTAIYADATYVKGNETDTDGSGGDVYIGIDPSHATLDQATRDADKLSQAVSGTTGIYALTSGRGSVHIATGTNGTVTGTKAAGIDASAVTGSVTIDAGDTVSGATYGVLARATGGGNVDVGGSGEIKGTTPSGSLGDPSYGNGISATANNGSVTVSGSGKTTATGAGTAIYGYIQSDGGTIRISRGGDVRAENGYGINAFHQSSGQIIMAGIGNVTSTGNTAVKAQGSGGDVNLGIDPDHADGGQAAKDADKLSGTIRGKIGIEASTTGSGSVNIATGSGGSVTGTGTNEADAAIKVGLGTGTGQVSVGSNSLVDGSASGTAIKFYSPVQAIAKVTNAGTIRGSIIAELPPGAVPSPSNALTNSGTIALADGQSVSGFNTLQNEANGVLTGTGDFGNVHAATGSFLKPGDRSKAGYGTMTVGNLTMETGSTLQVRAGPTSDGAGLASDRLRATGNVVLNGATLDVMASPDNASAWKTRVNYTVLTADRSLSGSMIAKTNLAFLTPTVKVNQAGKSVGMTLSPVSTPEAMTVLPGPNQKAVWDVLSPYQDKALTGKAAQLIDGFNNLSKDNAAQALEQLSGSSSTGAQNVSFGAVDLFSSAVLTQARTAGGFGEPGAAPSFQGSGFGPSAYAGQEPMRTAALKAASPKQAKPSPVVALTPVPTTTWRLWATTLGGQGTTDARAWQPRVTGNDWGLAAGFDYAIDPRFVAGVALGGTSSRFSVGHGATTGTVGGLHASLYGMATFDALYAAGGLGYGRLDTRATRTITAFGAPERYSSHDAGDAFTGQMEVGYRIAFDAMTVTPFAGLRATLLHLQGTTEKAENGGAANLAFASQNVWSAPGSLGLQVERSFALDADWTLTAQARAAWVHEFSPDRKARHTFVALPGSASFAVEGIGATQDLARLTGGVTLANGKSTSVFATLTSDLAPHARSYTIQGGVKVGW